MSALLLPSAVKSTLGLLQSGSGLLQGQPERPSYEIPSGIKEMVQKTRKQANLTERPGADAAKSLIKTNTANSIDSIKNLGGSSSNVVQGVINAQSNENKALLAENSKNEAFRYQSFMDNIQSLRELGSYQDKAWEWNEADRYLEKRDRRDALIGAGITNVSTGAEDLVSNALMAKFMGVEGMSMKELLGKQT